jgi:hypothetical protein
LAPNKRVKDDKSKIYCFILKYRYSLLKIIILDFSERRRSKKTRVSISEQEFKENKIIIENYKQLYIAYDFKIFNPFISGEFLFCDTQ